MSDTERELRDQIRELRKRVRELEKIVDDEIDTEPKPVATSLDDFDQGEER